MRLDLYLSNAGLVKRRTLARELCDAGRVDMNGIAGKPGKEIKVGDILTLRLSIGVKVIKISGLPAKSIPKKDGIDFYETIEFRPKEKRNDDD